MKVIIFGASGMIGQGALRESLEAPDVTSVTVVGRSKLSRSHPKLNQIILPDLLQIESIQDQLYGFDICLFTLGVSASDVDEATYTKINYEIPKTVASVLINMNPEITFIYVSGGGTDSSEQGSVMWARVKGKTENTLLKFGSRAIYLFRLGFVLPKNGEISKTPMYRKFYRWFGWALKIAKFIAPASVVDTTEVGRSMLQLYRKPEPKHYIYNKVVKRLSQIN